MNLELGLGAIVLLIIEVWAVLKIISSTASTGKKVLWIVFTLVIPVLGLICWFFLGPKGKG